MQVFPMISLKFFARQCRPDNGQLCSVAEVLPKPSNQGFIYFSRYLVFLLMVLSLSGCTIQLFYRQVDWLVPWYVDRQLDLNRSQKSELKQLVSRQILWHRGIQVPAYVATLTEWEAFFSASYSRKEFDILNLQTQNHMDVLTRHLLPDFSHFLYSLTSKQRISLYRLVQENNQEFYDEYLAEGIHLDKVRLSDSREAVISWLGSVNEEQEKKLIDLTSKYQSTEAETMKNRENWLYRLKDILESGASADIKSLKLSTLFLSPRESWSENYQTQFDFNGDISVQLIEQMLKYASPHQKEHLLQRVKKWRKAFEAISE